MAETLDSGTVSTRLERIAEQARAHPERAFRSIHHVIDMELLREAYRRTRKNAAPGVDGETADQFASQLEVRLEALLEKLKSGAYRAPPVKRVEIPKGDGSQTRPIGIPTFEDKVLQRAVTMVLEAIYEQDFYPGSYGFRPGRSAHDALEAVWKALMVMNGGWVVEADIESFFDSMDHDHLRGFLDRRVTDGVLRRATHKWLRAGALEDGVHRRSEHGTPQGGVISPLLANVYLHEVLDTWFEAEVKPRLGGRAELIRYADDFVIVCKHERDARRVFDVLPKRFARFGLRLHPDKTRVVRFERPKGPGSGGGPDTFDLLGFTHYWGKSRKGRMVVRRKTAKKRLNRAIKAVRRWCREHRHNDIALQHRYLSAALRGHYNYYGMLGNLRWLAHYYYRVLRAWRKWLSRRNSRPLTWGTFKRILVRFPLPTPRTPRRFLTSANL